MRFLIGLFFLMLFTSPAFSADPDTVIPTHTSGMYRVPGLFGSNPKYSENTIALLNYVDAQVEKVSSKPINLDLLAYGVSSGTCEQGFSIIAPLLISTDLSGLTPGDWEVLPPDSIVDALNRMSALLKTLNTNTAIP